VNFDGALDRHAAGVVPARRPRYISLEEGMMVKPSEEPIL
jgi:hypothetical protein